MYTDQTFSNVVVVGATDVPSIGNLPPRHGSVPAMRVVDKVLFGISGVEGAGCVE